MNPLKLAMIVFILSTISTIYSDISPISKGSKMIGGQIAFSYMYGDLYENYNDEGLRILQIAPSFGGFPINNIGIKINLIYESIGQGSHSNSSLGIGPSLLVFIGKSGEVVERKGLIYPFLGFTYLYQRMNDDFIFSEGGLSGYLLGLSVGLNSMITSSVGFISEVSLNLDNWSNDYISESGNKLNAAFGFLVFL